MSQEEGGGRRTVGSAGHIHNPHSGWLPQTHLHERAPCWARPQGNCLWAAQDFAAQSYPGEPLSILLKYERIVHNFFNMIFQPTRLSFVSLSCSERSIAEILKLNIVLFESQTRKKLNLGGQLHIWQWNQMQLKHQQFVGLILTELMFAQFNCKSSGRSKYQNSTENIYIIYEVLRILLNDWFSLTLKSV